MVDIFKKIKFWIEWSYWLRCKHCCLFCEYYQQCVEEVKDLEDKLEMNKFFD